MKRVLRKIAQTTVTIYLVGLCVPSAASGGASGGILTSLVPLTLLDSSVKQTKTKPPAKKRKPKPPPPDNDGSRKQREKPKPPKPPPERKKPPKYKPPSDPKKPENPNNRKPPKDPYGHERWPEKRPLPPPPPEREPPRPIIIIDPIEDYYFVEEYYYYYDDPYVPTLTFEEHNLLFTSLATVTNGLLAFGPKRSPEVAAVGAFFGVTSLVFAVAPGSEHRGWDLFFGAASLFFAAMNVRSPDPANPDSSPLLEFSVNF